MNLFHIFYFKKKPKPALQSETTMPTPPPLPNYKKTTNEEFNENLKKIPLSLVYHIFSFTYQTQNPALLNDIRNFHTTKNILLEKVCDNNPTLMTDIILTYYCYLFVQRNCNHQVLKNIEKWRNKNKTVKISTMGITIIQYPNELKLFDKQNKWIFLWGLLEPEVRNVYLNFLYSIFANRQNPLEMDFEQHHNMEATEDILDIIEMIEIMDLTEII